MEIYVHPRIAQKHPQLSEEDIKVAFRNQFMCAQRPTGEYVGVGMDGRCRLVELVYALERKRANVFHALTPPTNKVLLELQGKR